MKNNKKKKEKKGTFTASTRLGYSSKNTISLQVSNAKNVNRVSNKRFYYNVRTLNSDPNKIINSDNVRWDIFRNDSTHMFIY